MASVSVLLLSLLLPLLHLLQTLQSQQAMAIHSSPKAVYSWLPDAGHVLLDVACLLSAAGRCRRCCWDHLHVVCYLQERRQHLASKACLMIYGGAGNVGCGLALWYSNVPPLIRQT